jgi:hypothetical protein
MEESLHRNRSTRTSPVHEKVNRVGPPACAITVSNSPILALSETVGSLKLAGFPATAAPVKNCPRMAGGETRRGGHSPRPCPLLHAKTSSRWSDLTACSRGRLKPKFIH